MNKNFEFSEEDMNFLLDTLNPEDIQEFKIFIEYVISKSIKWYCGNSVVRKNVKWHNNNKLLCDIHYEFSIRRKKI